MIDKKHIENCFVHQLDTTDCGAACLLSITRYYGGDSSIYHIREISGTTNTGTTMLGLYQAAQKMGLNATGAEANSIQDLIDHKSPCILNVIVDKTLSHYVVCYGYDGRSFTICDPAKGIIDLSIEELSEIWTMKCLLLEPNAEFEKVDRINSKKRQWMLNLVKDDIGILGISVAIGLVISTLGMVMAIFSQKLVDEVLPARDFTKLIVGIVLVLFILILRSVISAFRSRLLIKQRRDFNNRIINFFFRKILLLPKAFFDTRKVGDMVARLNDTRRIQSVIGVLAGDVIINTLVVLVSICFMLVYSWKIATITVVSVPIFYWIVSRNNRKIMKQQREVMASYAMSESAFINTIEGIADIKGYYRQNSFLQYNSGLYSAFQEKQSNLGNTETNISLWAGISSAIIQMGIIALCASFVINESMTTGRLMALISLTSSLFPSVASLALIMVPVNEAKIAFERMYEIVDMEETEEFVNSSENHIRGYNPDEIKINNLAFRFVGRPLLLEGVSINIASGAITSIIGESGCGKSTLCQILQRFYVPESGNIYLDETNITDISIPEWRNLVSYVQQDTYMFNGTVLDNICFGEVPNDINNLLKFLDEYGFSQFVNELPNGLATLVGEDGINLSGGQKQLVSLIRALYKPHKILILDEATSAMDRRTEIHICNILEKLKIDHIIIFITHRIDTARRISDKIVVMESGHVIDQGTHNELMRYSNFYSDYWMTIE